MFAMYRKVLMLGIRTEKGSQTNINVFNIPEAYVLENRIEKAFLFDNHTFPVH